MASRAMIVMAMAVAAFAGCRAPQEVRIPVDIVLAPSVGVNVKTPSDPALDWQTIGLVALGIVALVVIAKVTSRKRV